MFFFLLFSLVFLSCEYEFCSAVACCYHCCSCSFFFISFDVLVLFWELKSGLWKVKTNEWQGISDSRIAFRPQTSTDTNNQTAFLERSTKLTSLQHHHHHSCNHYQRQLKLIIGIHRFSSHSWLFSIRAMLSLSLPLSYSLTCCNLLYMRMICIYANFW